VFKQFSSETLFQQRLLSCYAGGLPMRYCTHLPRAVTLMCTAVGCMAGAVNSGGELSC
jgi:hypothetical protein